MIGSVTGASQTAYTAAATRTRPADAAPTQTTDSQAAAEVDLSPGGKLLSDLPPIILDPRVHMANAEKRLAELMGELGIPPGTKIDIHLSSSGQFTVKGDSDKLQTLEDRLNDGTEMDLRNSLIGAHTSSVIQRIAAATQTTQQKVDANPGATEALWNQLLAEADRIKGQSMDFAYAQGALQGAFADGTAVAIA